MIEEQGDTDSERGKDGVTESQENEAPTVALSPRTPVSSSLTSPGLIMGTVAYMSPEQAQGKIKEIDHRSDIFSFGCILFETVTGRKPFQGDSIIKTLHQLVYEPAPPLEDFNPAAPVGLKRIVRRCLAKDPDDRYQSIKDVAIELKDVRSEIGRDALLEIAQV